MDSTSLRSGKSVHPTWPTPSLCGVEPLTLRQAVALADPGPPPQRNAQAWESDEPRRNRHAAAPSTHPGGGAATAAATAPRPPEPEVHRMVLSQKHLAPQSQRCLVSFRPYRAQIRLQDGRPCAQFAHGMEPRSASKVTNYREVYLQLTTVP